MGGDARRRAAWAWLVLVGGCCSAGAPPRAAPTACPDEMVVVGGRFCIDRFEASLVVDGADGERGHPPNMPVLGAAVRAVSRPGVVPQSYVSQREAASACAASAKRLCTDDEWRDACGDAFPYGPTRRAGACNGRRRRLLGRVVRTAPVQ